MCYSERYKSFPDVLNLAQLKSLKIRRLELITQFSKKALRSDTFKHWFVEESEKIGGYQTRNRKIVPLLKPVQCRTKRYEKSSIPFMTKLLSWHPPLVYTPLDLA